MFHSNQYALLKGGQKNRVCPIFQGAPHAQSINPAQPIALVLGITGGYGKAMAQALLSQGWTLRALVRDLARAQETLPAQIVEAVAFTEGDVFDRGPLEQAAQGVDVIVHGINLPQPEWPKRMLPVAQRVIEAARVNRATIAYPGNVYPFAPGTSITPDTPMQPPQEKGHLRVQVAQALAQASAQGVQVITLRAGDFFGLGHASSWMKHILQKARAGGPLQVPAHPNIRHAWAYLPDLAHAHVQLLEQRHTPLGEALRRELEAAG